MSDETIDIYSKGKYPANVLSNFYPNSFVFDGIKCGSMEGFLQSLKFRNQKKQVLICQKYGFSAKAAGRRKLLWKLTGMVFHQGKRYFRQSEAYGALIFRAYSAMYEQNKGFSEALQASKGKTLVHSIGRHDKRRTILTEEEFLVCLNRLRTNRK